MQQYFHPSAKPLRYKQARSQGEHSGAVLLNFFVAPKFYCGQKNLFQTYSKN